MIPDKSGMSDLSRNASFSLALLTQPAGVKYDICIALDPCKTLGTTETKQIIKVIERETRYLFHRSSAPPRVLVSVEPAASYHQGGL